MRVIPIPPPPAQPLTPVPATSSDRESIAVTWCREIATAVAAALGTQACDVGYRLTRHPNLPAPRSLHTAFTVNGPTRWHTARIAVVWDDVWRGPGFALSVDDRTVDLDPDSPARPAVVLAHAAWRAVADTDHVVGVR